MDQNLQFHSKIPTGEVGVESESSLPMCLPNGNTPCKADTMFHMKEIFKNMYMCNVDNLQHFYPSTKLALSCPLCDHYFLGQAMRPMFVLSPGNIVMSQLLPS